MTVFVKNTFLWLLINSLVIYPPLYAQDDAGNAPPVPLPYSMKAYSQLFAKIDDIDDEKELKNTIKDFIKQYDAELTLPVFYEQVAKACSDAVISYDQMRKITNIIKDWLAPPQTLALLNSAASSKISEPMTDDLPLSARQIQDYLNQRIIGEEKAMEALAVYVDRHYQSIRINTLIQMTGLDVTPLKKLNLLLVGPTGSGKTASISHLAKLLQVPFFEGDVSTFSRTGYVGDSASSVVEGLLKVCGYNRELTEKGIIFLDEVDKIAARPGGNYRDITGSDVQAELLKLMEGKEVVIKQKTESGGDKTYTIHTRNILFIGGGAFSELPAKANHDYTISDFTNIGFKPELLGRFGEMIFFNAMTKEKMSKILTSSIVSPIRENEILLKLGYKVHLKFEEDCLPLIAEKAFKLGLGARGLFTVVNKILKPIISHSEDYKGKTVVVDQAMIESLFEQEMLKDGYQPWLSMYS